MRWRTCLCLVSDLFLAFGLSLSANIDASLAGMLHMMLLPSTRTMLNIYQLPPRPASAALLRLLLVSEAALVVVR